MIDIGKEPHYKEWVLFDMERLDIHNEKDNIPICRLTVIPKKLVPMFKRVLIDYMAYKDLLPF